MQRRTYLQLGLAGLAGGSFTDLLALQRATANENLFQLYLDLDGRRSHPSGDF